MLIAWAISVVATFFLGFYLRTLKDALEVAKKVIETKVEKKPEEEPKSLLIDPLDPISEAKYEMEKQMRELNGE